MSDINRVKMLDNKEIYKDVSERHPLCCSQELTLFGVSLRIFFLFMCFPRKICVFVYDHKEWDNILLDVLQVSILI